jgi:hypothetical protein
MHSDNHKAYYIKYYKAIELALRISAVHFIGGGGGGGY